MNDLLPPEFRAGQKLTDLRAPLNQLRAAILHCLRDTIRTGPGMLATRRGNHILLSSTAKPARPHRGGTPATYTATVTPSTEGAPPTTADLRAAIISAIGSATPKPEDICILSALAGATTQAKFSYRFTAQTFPGVTENEFLFSFTANAVTLRAVGTQLGWWL